ncbi:MAG: heme-binding domain-containing protein [Lachnospiraceae bacterium]|nr:heme-binding domain-containing protein [Lachnospiraceae bacterium]
MADEQNTKETGNTGSSKKKWWLAVLVALIVCVIAYIGVSMSGRAITADTTDGRFVQVLENNGCLACHAENPPAVWYEGLPGVSGTIAQDKQNAYRFIDLEAVVEQVNAGEVLDAPTVAKIEQSVRNNSMPVTSYATVHPGSSLNGEEQQIVLDWVREQKTAQVTAFAENYGMNLDDASLERAVSEPVMILPEPGYGVDMEMAMLGLDLYHDTRLSGDNTLACASCHQLSHGGEDGQPHARGITGNLGGVSAPTVYNAVFNVLQFWDGRAADLHAQAAGPPTNPVEMGSESWEDIADRLSEDPEMVKRFEAVFGKDNINVDTITQAIAEFEKLLITPNSPFDRYLMGDDSAISADAAQGYELFKKYYCATCHTGASMGGQSFELLGTVTDAAVYFEERGYGIEDGDMGRYAETGVESDMYRFKVPNLRNLELTGPYFHDGTQLSIQQAVRTMFRFQTDHPQPTDDEVNKIVAFLMTLTGENEYMTYDFYPSNNIYPSYGDEE